MKTNIAKKGWELLNLKRRRGGPRWWLECGVRMPMLRDSRNLLEKLALHLEHGASIRIKLCNILNP
jgi:hypothetical protein